MQLIGSSPKRSQVKLKSYEWRWLESISLLSESTWISDLLTDNE